MKELIKLSLVILTAGILGCSNGLDSLSIYKVDIQQGNVLTQEMVNQLKPGMTKEQVKFIMGSPMVTDPFQPDTWIYVYRFVHDDEITEDHKLTLQFGENGLSHLNGDIVPNQQVSG